MNNLKQKILWILSEDEQSRNSDIRLTQMIWYKFYNSKIINLDDGTKAVRLRDLFDLPREDNIKRVRAKIQNEEMLIIGHICKLSAKKPAMRLMTCTSILNENTCRRRRSRC